MAPTRMNRSPSARPLLLIAACMTLADLHACIDFAWVDTCVHGRSTLQAWLSPTCIYRIGMCDTYPRQSPDLMPYAPTWGESLLVYSPALDYSLRCYSHRFRFMYRFSIVRDVRAWMLNAAGTTLADLRASIESATTIQSLCLVK